MRRVCLCLIAAALAACATDPDAAPGDLPLPPDKADGGGFTITGARAWYLIGNDLTAGNDTLDLTITGPSSARYVDLWIDREYVTRARRTSGGRFRFTVDLVNLDLAASEHQILLAADGARYAFAAPKFQRSQPLYVAVSNDWDTADNGDAMLERQERLHARHPALVITHFVGPYTFTETSIAPARARYLVDWVTRLRDEQGDEIGLHIHPYCSFVRAAGVTCRTSPSFAYATGDTTGYTVYLGAYTRTQLEQMLAKADELFVANGLGKPTSFRAGGWTAELNVIEALGTAGHVADSSGCNWSRLEEWSGHAGASLYGWNAEHWAPIDETSQPYYPSADDILADAEPHLPVLEVPDNGLLVDYVTGAEMIEMFRANWSGGALAEPVTYAIGYHPPNFSEAYFVRMDEALTEIDRHLAADDRGPVVYARMSDLPKVYKRP